MNSRDFELMKGNVLRYGLMVLMFWAGQTPLDSQPPSRLQTASEQSDEFKDVEKWTFLQLRDKREALESRITQLSSEISHLEPTKAYLDARLQRLDSLRLQLKLRQQDPGLTSEIHGLEQELQNPQFNTITRDLDNKKADLAGLKKQKDLLEEKIAYRIDLESPRQKFKTNMSITFAILVGCVIVGFFAVSFRDEVVRREVFSGQSGIQFLTLFSIVIAIILFGITEILEGKELAALLGGLSGYILGRTMSQSSRTPTSPRRNLASPGTTPDTQGSTPGPGQEEGSQVELRKDGKTG